MHGFHSLPICVIADSFCSHIVLCGWHWLSYWVYLNRNHLCSSWSFKNWTRLMSSLTHLVKSNHILYFILFLCCARLIFQLSSTKRMMQANFTGKQTWITILKYYGLSCKWFVTFFYLFSFYFLFVTSFYCNLSKISYAFCLKIFRLLFTISPVFAIFHWHLVDPSSENP